MTWRQRRYLAALAVWVPSVALAALDFTVAAYVGGFFAGLAVMFAIAVWAED